MAEDSLVVVKQPIVDLLGSEQSVPALSSTSDLPVIETKPDAQAAAPEPAKEKELEQPADSATAATETEQPGEPAKKESRGVQKALDRLTSERETEKRRAEAAEARLDAALKALERTTGKPEVTEPSDADEPARPSRNDFPDPDSWDAALLKYAEEKAVWTTRREIKSLETERQQAEQTKAVEEGQRVAREAYNGRVSKVLDKYPDFKEVAESPDVEISMPMAHAIIHSERGPELQYYLGKNPDEAKRITALSPPLQLVELGVILAKIDAPVVKPVSAAPKPIKPISAGTEPAAKDPNEMSMDEYKAYTLARDRGGAMRH